MNELIKVNEETMTVSARELHEKLNINTKFSTWFERMTEYGFVKDVDFFPKMGKTSDIGGRPATDYDVTIAMAKEIPAREEVMVFFRDNGYPGRVINVAMDSGIAMLKDVLNHIDIG